MTWEFQFLYWLQSVRTDGMDWLMTRISMLGNAGWFWILLGVLLLIGVRTRRAGITVLLSLAAGAVIGNLLLKNMVMRDRPCWIDPQISLLVTSPRDFSFPSGHTLAAFESAVSILLWNKRWGMLAMIPAVLVSFSRLYLFVHFPTDVMAGAVLGTVLALFAAGLAGQMMQEPKGQKAEKQG